MKKMTKIMACMFAAMFFVPSVLMAQKDASLEAELDSAQIAYLQEKGKNDGRFCDSIFAGMYGPTDRIYYTIEIPNAEDSTKVDTVSLTEEVRKLYGWQIVAGISAGMIADGTLYDKSVTGHLSPRFSAVIGLEGRQLGFGDNELSNRVNCGIYGRIFMTEYAPKTTSAGKKYVAGEAEAFVGYDILGQKEGIHVLSIGPVLGFGIQKMDSILDREKQLVVVDQAWNAKLGLRLQYNVIIPKSGTSFSFILSGNVSQVKLVNYTHWTPQVELTFQVGQLFKTRIAKQHFKKRNKEIEEQLKPKDDNQLRSKAQ
jgi:hypothetical protein